MQFPRLVYKAADVHTLAEDEDEHAELIEAGWFNSVPEAIAKKHTAVEQVEPVAVKKAEGWNKAKTLDEKL